MLPLIVADVTQAWDASTLPAGKSVRQSGSALPGLAVIWAPIADRSETR
jgi:hypothetical protein